MLFSIRAFIEASTTQLYLNIFLKQAEMNFLSREKHMLTISSTSNLQSRVLLWYTSFRSSNF